MEHWFFYYVGIPGIISIATFCFTIYKFHKQEKYNSDLEKLKYSFEYNLTSYRIYIELKHNRIISVNHYMVKAYSAVSNITSLLKTYPDFSQWTVNQISLGENEKKYILNHWEINKSYAIKEVVYWCDISKCIKGHNLVNKLKKHLLYVRLYIKEEDFNLLFDFAHLLDRVLIQQEEVLDEIRGLSYDNRELLNNIKNDMEQAEVLNEQLIALLRKALEVELI